MEYLVKPIRRIQDFDELKDHLTDFEEHVQEDTAYPCLHFTDNHEGLKSYTPYLGTSIRRIQGLLYMKILEDINCGPYSNKSPIRRIPHRSIRCIDQFLDASDSGDDNTQSDKEKGSDSEHETDENEMGSKSDQEENEEDVEDDEEEKDDEFVKALSNSTDNEDETNVEDKAEVNTDEGFTQKEGTDDDMINVQQGNENPEITLNQVIEDAHVIISTVPKKTEVNSSSHSSDLAAKFLNFADIPTTNAEIISLMDVHSIHVEEPEFEVANSEMPQDQEENLGDDDEEPKRKITNLTQETLLGPAFKLLKGTRTNFAELEYDFEECYKALSKKLD
ncbi:hypothetical protein Tco_1254273 [Tanacetum coccineum]